MIINIILVVLIIVVVIEFERYIKNIRMCQSIEQCRTFAIELKKQSINLANVCSDNTSDDYIKNIEFHRVDLFNTLEYIAYFINNSHINDDIGYHYFGLTILDYYPMAETQELIKKSIDENGNTSYKELIKLYTKWDKIRRPIENKKV